MPNVKEGETIYEYMVDEKSTWQLWRPPAWALALPIRPNTSLPTWSTRP